MSDIEDRVKGRRDLGYPIYYASPLRVNFLALNADPLLYMPDFSLHNITRPAISSADSQNNSVQFHAVDAHLVCFELSNGVGHELDLKGPISPTTLAFKLLVCLLQGQSLLALLHKITACLSDSL